MASRHPQARIVDPFAPDSTLTVWIATNPLTRKVFEIKRGSPEDERRALLHTMSRTAGITP